MLQNKGNLMLHDVETPQQRSCGVKPKGNSTQVSGPSQPASNPCKGGTA